jgi:hypothetical protein
MIIPIYGKSNIGNKRELYTNNVTGNESKTILTFNAITLFNKEVQFGMSSNEFIERFDEFKLDSKEGNEISYKYETNYSNSFDNYWITVKFTDNKLVFLELSGWQTEEYMKIIKATIKQLKFDKTIIEKDEEVGDTKTDYYHKDDLKAECFSFETTVLKIYLNR